MKNIHIIVVVVLSAITFASCTIPTTVEQQVNFKVLCYNVLYGLQNDSAVQDHYVKWVKEINPDIIAYQEMNDFTQRSLEIFAARYQHDYAIMSKVDGFPTALSSCYPIVNVQKVVDNMWHAYIYANINDIHVFVLHFSPHSLEKRRAEVRQILAHAALLPQNEKIMILGDFNALSDDDAASYSDQYVEQRRIREVQNDHIRNLDNGKLDFSVIQAMKNAGYIDAYRMFHEDFKASIPTRKYGDTENNGSRIDFVWLNSELAKYVVSAECIHDEDTDVMSDHYPLLVEFSF